MRRSDYQRANGGRLGSNLVKLGIISDDVITAVLSRQYGVPSINLDLFQIEDDVIKLISQEVALKYTVLPISKVGATLTLAMADPTNVFAMDDIKFMTGLNVEPVIASEASIQIAIGKYYSGSNADRYFRRGIRRRGRKGRQRRRTATERQERQRSKRLAKTSATNDSRECRPRCFARQLRI